MVVFMHGNILSVPLKTTSGFGIASAQHVDFKPHFAHWKTQLISIIFTDELIQLQNFIFHTFRFLDWLYQCCLETSYFEIKVLSLLTGCCLVIANNAVLFRPVHSCSFMNSLVQYSRNFIVSNSKLLTGWCLVIALSCSSAGLLCLAMVPVYDQINTC